MGGKLTTAPFLGEAERLGSTVVAGLKDNYPGLRQAVEARFAYRPPDSVFRESQDRIEIWDVEDFDPREAVRVVRYRQSRADGQVIRAEWLTSLPQRKVDSVGLYPIAKSRWGIENQGFNDGRSCHRMGHIRHRKANSLVVSGLLIVRALAARRLCRPHYLHCDGSGVRSAPELVSWLRSRLERLRGLDRR